MDQKLQEIGARLKQARLAKNLTQQQLADKMFALGCVQAYNLDGGNSAEMVFGDKIIKGMPGGDERGLSDIIYFASAEQ